MRQFFLVVILVGAGTLPAAGQEKAEQPDFMLESLPVLWQAGSEADSVDASAELIVRSTDSCITVKITVKDSQLVFNNDLTKSDHVELWISATNPEGFPDDDDNYGLNRRTWSPIVTPDSIWLYRYKGEADTDGVSVEFMSPHIGVLGVGRDTVVAYNDADSVFWDLKYVKEEIGSFLAVPRGATLQKVDPAFASVHFAIDPKTKHVTQLDRDDYKIIERQLGVTFPDFSHAVSVQSAVTEQGYTLIASFPPASLGFMELRGLYTVEIGATAFGFNANGSMRYVLGTRSPQSDPEGGVEQQTVTLLNRQHVLLLPRFPEIGGSKETHSDTPSEELMPSISKMFLLSSEGWIPVDAESPSFHYWEGPGGATYELPYIQQMRYVRGTLKYTSARVGVHTVEHMKTSTEEFLIADSTEVRNARNVVKSFLLPDGSFACLTSDCSISGHTDDYAVSELSLSVGNGQRLVAKYESQGEDESEMGQGAVIVFTNNVKIKEPDWGNGPGQECIDWESFLTWEKKGEVLIFDDGHSQRVRIRWDKHGKNVHCKKLEPKNDQ